MTPYDMATRFVGEVNELEGPRDHPFIQWGHSLCGLGMDSPDEVPWCSSFLNSIAWILRLPRSKSAAARSWLSVGIPIVPMYASVGYDVVILNRSNGPNDPSVAGPGHVGLFAGHEGTSVLLLGGNQSNAINISRFPAAQILGIRSLKTRA